MSCAVLSHDVKTSDLTSGVESVVSRDDCAWFTEECFAGIAQPVLIAWGEAAQVRKPQQGAGSGSSWGAIARLQLAQFLVRTRYATRTEYATPR